MTNQFLIKEIKSRWILDSRGFPTVETDVITYNGILGRAAVPSGASTGEYEVVELRDGGKKFMGKGVEIAVNNVVSEIAKNLINQDVRDQNKIDKIMIELDGTKNKSRLGGNAILSVSLAVAVASAKVLNMKLYEYLNTLYRNSNNLPDKYIFPVPISNILNGGKHAGNDLSIQEFMVVPIGAKSFKESIIMISEIYHNLKEKIKLKFGKSAINLGDEGGFAPNLSYTRDALDLINNSIEDLGYKSGNEVFIAIDAAASEFYKNSQYYIDNKNLTPNELIDYYLDLIKTYPIISIEDPFEENDFKSHTELMTKTDIQIVGDDLFVTQLERIKRGAKEKSANALLLKVNQVGSLSEALSAAKFCEDNKMNVIVSHRSGETEDTFIADLVIGLSFKKGMIKTGAPARSERTAKYNRLIRIEEEVDKKAIFAGVNYS